MSNIDWNLASKVMVMAIIISVIFLFLGIGALIFIHVCIVARTFRAGLIRNNVAGAMVERSSIGSTSMSRDDVEKLPCYEYLAKSKGSSPIECAVCLDNFNKGDKCRLLPICNHSFHAQCVDAWLLTNPNCPICRSTANSRRFGEESSRFSDIDVELREGVPREGLDLSDIRIELSDHVSFESSRPNQTDSNPSLLQDSSLETVL
ncbi:RING-type domain-containing protein [Citrus sinensis]|uniref:RING-type domain-containing protein n=1 Tax=Citrus sinensis TaxID=2711 RepID=A0ACB8MYQ0_CITSI|nr:RING-type domain-containing protein [Citrus sinensis]